MSGRADADDAVRALGLPSGTLACLFDLDGRADALLARGADLVVDHLAELLR
jgi:hypothetical protein